MDWKPTGPAQPVQNVGMSNEAWLAAAPSAPSRSSSISSAPLGPSHQAPHHGFHGHHRPGFSRQGSVHVHPALANLTPIIPGGKVDATYSGLGLNSRIQAGLKKGEEDAERARRECYSSDGRLRKGLREWRQLETESKLWGWRSEPPRGEEGEGVGGVGSGGF